MPHNLSGSYFKKLFNKRFNFSLDEQFWVDEISKIIFPASFGIFNLIFWCYVFLGNPGQCDEIEKNGFIKLQD